MPLDHVDRILENVNHGVAAETGVAIRRSQSKTATNQTAAHSTKLTQQRFELRESSGMIGFRLIRQSDIVPIVRFHFEPI